MQAIVKNALSDKTKKMCNDSSKIYLYLHFPAKLLSDNFMYLPNIFYVKILLFNIPVNKQDSNKPVQN